MKKKLSTLCRCLGLWGWLLVGFVGSPEAQEEFLDISKNWRFRLDPKNQGVQEGWYRLDWDDSAWDTVDAGQFWESLGYEYDGYAWYRKWVAIPKQWKGQRVYLGFGGVDDIYVVFINGKKVATVGDTVKRQSYVYRYSFSEITSEVRFGDQNLIAVQVYDWGGVGGIHRKPVGVSTDSLYFVDPRSWVKQLAQKYPQGLWPFWVQGKGRAWTMVGLENQLEEGLRSFDTSVGATTWPFSMTWWVKDETTGHLLAPERYEPSEIRAYLYQGHLPISITEIAEGDLLLRSLLFVAPAPDIAEGGVAFYQIRLTNRSTRSKSLTLWLALRPYLVHGRVGEVSHIRWDKGRRALVVNDRFVLCVPEGAQAFLGSRLMEEGDISRLLLEGSAQPLKEISDSRERAMGALVYRRELKPGETLILEVRAPLSEVSIEKAEALRRLNSTQKFREVVSYWNKRLRRIYVELPDSSIVHALYASLAYILISMDKDMPHPGPLAYDYFWYRDSAYILAALLRMGLADVARKSLHYFMEAQKESGEFPSIFDVQLKPIGPHEWDAQGQALFALAQYYQFTKDAELVSRYWPHVLKAAQFVREIRKKNLKDEYRGTPLYGILPPSASAEDLGPDTWHHYWDDFWVILGLKQIARVAQEIGRPSDARRLQELAEDLLHWTKESYRLLMRQKGIHWIPNGPEDLEGTSMARGTSPAIWPGNLLPPDDPVVQASFRHYYEKWIKPYGGAYYHQGKLWPYGFELALGYVLIGQKEIAHEILQWHLQHQTFPGNYAWGEQLDPKTAAFVAGDIPHCWVAADYINLVLGMLLFSYPDRIALLSGVHEKWLTTGKRIAMRNAPTYFGSLDFQAAYRPETQQLTLELGGSASPPQGFVLANPFKDKRIRKAWADGSPLSVDSGQRINFPAGVKKVVLQF